MIVTLNDLYVNQYMYDIKKRNVMFTDYFVTE